MVFPTGCGRETPCRCEQGTTRAAASEGRCPGEPPMSVAPTCPDCGAALPRDTLAGLCPRCLLAAALAGPVDPSAAAIPSPPGPERATTDTPAPAVPTH